MVFVTGLMHLLKNVSTFCISRQFEDHCTEEDPVVDDQVIPRCKLFCCCHHHHRSHLNRYSRYFSVQTRQSPGAIPSRGFKEGTPCSCKPLPPGMFCTFAYELQNSPDVTKANEANLGIHSIDMYYS